MSQLFKKMSPVLLVWRVGGDGVVEIPCRIRMSHSGCLVLDLGWLGFGLGGQEHTHGCLSLSSLAMDDDFPFSLTRFLRLRGMARQA
jgi:hypothetical protein